MISQQKNYKILYHQNYLLIEKPVIIFLNPDTYQNYLRIFLKNTKAQVLLGFFFFSARGPDTFLTSSHV